MSRTGRSAPRAIHHPPAAASSRETGRPPPRALPHTGQLPADLQGGLGRAHLVPPSCWGRRARWRRTRSAWRPHRGVRAAPRSGGGRHVGAAGHSPATSSPWASRTARDRPGRATSSRLPGRPRAAAALRDSVATSGPRAPPCARNSSSTAARRDRGMRDVGAGGRRRPGPRSGRRRTRASAAPGSTGSRARRPRVATSW